MTRELDRRVFKAMGLRVKHWRDETDGGTNLVDQDGEYFGPWSDYDPHPKWRWSPSTDIAAAWQVVEWMKAKGGDFYMERRSGADYWVMFILDENDTQQWHCADAPTAPKAICLAFLKVVEPPTPSSP